MTLFENIGLQNVFSDKILSPRADDIDDFSDRLLVTICNILVIVVAMT